MIGGGVVKRCENGMQKMATVCSDHPVDVLTQFFLVSATDKPTPP